MASAHDRQLSERIRRATGASQVQLGERVQSLWGGANQRDVTWRVPELLHAEADAGRFLLVLEDLDQAGYSERRTQCSAQEIGACLGWLAAFHARFLGTSPEALWKVGSYWHLATRPDELARLESAELRRAAVGIDQRLNSARFRTLIHGDAKLENFCFASSGLGVAAVDFQYVGGGVGVKDVAYFLSSCLSPDASDAHVSECVDQYFAALRAELVARGSPLAPASDQLEAEWRVLFPWAWADFQRFLLGWAPSYAKREVYGERQLEAALSALSACN